MTRCPTQSPPSPFFFSSDGDHRALHSFPTRRSSDLVNVPTSARYSTQPRASPRRLGRGWPRPGAIETTTPRAWSRSEEHTSELQSRGHLVCRLLLEKKKKNKRLGVQCI